MSAFVAVDLGAESGRVIVGQLEQQKIVLHEVHRFLHATIELPTGLHWDVTGLWSHITTGLKKAAAWSESTGVTIKSIGVDTWGVDWCLVSESGELCGLPHAYRDPRNAEAFEQAKELIGANEIYQATGIQLMMINSLYSLYAQKLADDAILKSADSLMFMPDLFHYWMSGTMSCESSIASTSQILNVHTKDWDPDLCAALGLPIGLLLPISPAGTSIGTIRQNVAQSTGLSSDVKVVLPPSHDTASAIAAVPVQGDREWAYLSSGTWSLLGAEIAEPCVSPAAREAMFTNETGVDGTIRFLKNIAGLWLVQQCRADWSQTGERLSYAELTEAAGQSEAFRTLVDPDYLPFQSPGNMLQKINDFAKSTGQPICESHGQFIRCCLESLAMAYRKTLETLESILDKKFEVLHIVGGGGQNRLLNEMTASAIGIEVVVGPFEATAVGNALVQAMSAGEVANLESLRQIVCHSFDLQTFVPSDTDQWETQFQRFKKIVGLDSE